MERLKIEKEQHSVKTEREMLTKMLKFDKNRQDLLKMQQKQVKDYNQSV
jgi:hypothetical protein